MKSKKSVFAVLAATIAAAVLIVVLLQDNSFEKTTYAMAATVNVKLEGKNCEEIAKAISDRIVECENREISRNISSSDVSKLNVQKSLEVSEKTAAFLNSLKSFSADCNGAVDVTIGELTKLWNIGGDNFKVPDDMSIKSALSGIGYEQIIIDNKKVSIGKNQTLDLGCAGKGIACDEALEIIKSGKINKAVVSVGGSVLLWSKKADDEFTVGIRNPKKGASDYAVTVKTGNAFVSTSGTYERFSVDKNGKEYHHILSTETGFPVENDVLSVTVFCNNGLFSDALSSACLVLGLENSRQLLKKYNASAVFIFKDNTLRTSDDFSYEINVKNGDYVLL